MSKGAAFRKWSRIIHRDVSYLFAGMILIYALSGILMNHRSDLNPHYSVSLHEYKVTADLSDKTKIDKALVLTLLEPWGEALLPEGGKDEGLPERWLEPGSQYTDR